MTCKKCRYEFCWVCLADWSSHGTSWYNCNRFEDKQGVQARDTQAKSRASLERYLHVSQPAALTPGYLHQTTSSSRGTNVEPPPPPLLSHPVGFLSSFSVSCNLDFALGSLSTSTDSRTTNSLRSWINNCTRRRRRKWKTCNRGAT